MKKYSFLLPIFLMVIVVGLDGCKSDIDEGYNPPASPHVEISDGVRTQGFDILAYINKPGG